MSGWLQLLAGSAFLAGLMGGVHCAAMCGGWVAAACGGERGRRFGYPLAYNAGRLASYALAGALAGALGEASLWLRGGAVMQQLLLALAGSALVMVALYLSGVAPFIRALEAAGGVVWRQVQPYSRWFLPVNSLPRAAALGALWGWLPCGMVYAMLLAALATGEAWQGALVMTAFGLGTLPNLLAISFFFERLGRWRKMRPVRVIASVVIAGFGVLGILKAAQPAAFAPDGVLCHLIPGLPELLQETAR